MNIKIQVSTENNRTYDLFDTSAVQLPTGLWIHSCWEQVNFSWFFFVTLE